MKDIIQTTKSSSTSTITSTRGKNKPKKATRQACMYCSIRFDKLKQKCDLKEEKDALKWDKHVKRTVYQCSVCQVYLCTDHFEPFHKDTTKEGSDSEE